MRKPPGQAALAVNAHEKLSTDSLSFGPFSLNLATSSVLRDGVDLMLRPQAFQVLRTLAGRYGLYVDYQQLIRDAWGGTIVSRHTVASTVGAVRQTLGEYGSWITYRPKFGYRLQAPTGDDLLRTGWHYWNRLTGEGIEKALGCFERAAAQNPGDPAAFDGVSSCYSILATFGMRPPVEVYGQFREAQQQAAALGGWTPRLRLKQARMHHVFELRFGDAEAELQALMKLPMPLLPVYLNLSMVLASLKRLDEAATTLAQARLSDPLYQTLPATEVFVHFCRREFEAAVVSGKQGLDLHPHQNLGRAYYAQALEFCGHTDEALAQYRLASALSPEMFWLKALEARCLGNAGRYDEAFPVYEDLQKLRFTEYVDAYYMALLAEALGKRDEAVEDLNQTIEEHSPTIYMLDVDPKMDSLRQDRRFAKIRDLVFSRA